MKWMALLCFVVSAKGLDAGGNCTNQEKGDHGKISILKISQTLLVSQWDEAVKSTPAPTVEHGEHGGEQFRDVLNQIVTRWGQGIVDSFYNQSVAVSQNLIDDVEDKYNKLVNSTGQSSKSDSRRNITETDLEDLVNQMKTLLDLKPGSQTIDENPLPELPKQPTKVVSRTENHTASDIFLYLPESINSDASSVYGFMSSVFLKGWYTMRKYLKIWQLQYRNQLLNDSVLPVYRKIVEKVFKNRDSIQRCVTKDTWSSFENYGNCIIKISNEWLQTLAELEKCENSS